MDKYSETIQHTFLDYLAGGYELNFMVAVDFTGIPFFSLLNMLFFGVKVFCLVESIYIVDFSELI